MPDMLSLPGAAEQFLKTTHIQTVQLGVSVREVLLGVRHGLKNRRLNRNEPGRIKNCNRKSQCTQSKTVTCMPDRGRG
jgi:hypothetical protein